MASDPCRDYLMHYLRERYPLATISPSIGMVWVILRLGDEGLSAGFSTTDGWEPWAREPGISWHEAINCLDMVHADFVAFHEKWRRATEPWP